MAFKYRSSHAKLYAQDLFDESVTQKAPLGARWDLIDGRSFVYTKNGAGTLVPSILLQSPVPDAAHDELVCTAAAVGATQLIVTLGASACVANQYAEGYVRLNKGTLLGYCYKIRNHLANAGSLALTLNIYDSLIKAVTDEEGSLVQHPLKDLIIHPAPNTAAVQGVVPMAITANYYFWLQVKGPCAVLGEGTLVIGQAVKPSATTDGAVTVKAEADTHEPYVGQVIQVGVTAEVSMINLAIPGY